MRVSDGEAQPRMCVSDGETRPRIPVSDGRQDPGCVSVMERHGLMRASDAEARRCHCGSDEEARPGDVSVRETSPVSGDKDARGVVTAIGHAPAMKTNLAERCCLVTDDSQPYTSGAAALDGAVRKMMSATVQL